MPRLKSLPGRLTPIAPRIVALPKVTDPHYLTREHRMWADAVKRRAGFACEQCGRNGVRLFADHIEERADGGAPFDLANGQALCGACHTRKTAARREARKG